MDNLYNRVARRRQSPQSGFTLIELLVVIAVLAVLALIVIFNVAGVFNRGQSSSCATDAKSVQTASDAYYSDHSSTYPNGTGAANTGGTGTTAAAQVVDVAALTPTYLHTPPGNGETFAYTDTKGTVQGTVNAAAC